MLIDKYSPIDFEPHKLNRQEINNPYLVIESFFDYSSLPKIRAELWEWLVLTITSDEFDILSGSYKSDIILLYEMTEKLVEAAHVIYQRRKRGVA